MTTNELLIMKKRIDLAASPVLYDRKLSAESFAQDWEPLCGQWRFEDGAMWGKNPLPAPGCILLRRPMPGNVLVDFQAATVAPSTHDIDVMWNASWDRAKDARGTAYVAGIQGWWSGNVGIEKSPQYKLVATAPCPWFQAGRQYHVQAGSIDGHCFLFVDGVLRLEMLDPDPLDSAQSTGVGFEAYQSQIRISDVVVRQIVWQAREQAYPKEF
jgi:hypothetical protein